MLKLLPIACLSLGVPAALLAQQKTASTGGVATVRSMITVESRQKTQPPPQLNQGDVMAFEHKQRLQVTRLIPWSRESPRLELFLLIDDASSSLLGNQLPDLRRFIESQPPSAQIGVAYMRDAAAHVVRDLTPDHAAAANSLRLPLASPGIMPSPYLALQDLIKRWPPGANRREVILISSGIDPLGGFGPVNPYLDSAIEDSQRHGVVVYTIYMPAAGHGGHSFFRQSWAQNHLAQLADETGGECYMLGFGPPVAFAPYLDEIATHLAHQYTVEFLVTTEPKAAFHSVHFATEIPNAELIAPSRVYLPASEKVRK